MSIHRGLPALFDFSGALQAADEEEQDREAEALSDHEQDGESELEEPGPRRYGLAQAVWTLYQAALVEDPPAR